GAAGGLGGKTVGAPAPSGSPPPRGSVRPHPLLQEIVARRAAPDKPRSPTRCDFSDQDRGGATTGPGSATGPRPGRRAGGAYSCRVFSFTIWDATSSVAGKVGHTSGRPYPKGSGS